MEKNTLKKRKYRAIVEKDKILIKKKGKHKKIIAEYPRNDLGTIRAEYKLKELEEKDHA